MVDLGKVLIFLGIGLAVLGAIVFVMGRAGFRGLPGDVSYQGGHVRIYFPIVTCIVLSILLTLISWLWNWIGRK
jgi:hypothetical protein